MRLVLALLILLAIPVNAAARTDAGWRRAGSAPTCSSPTYTNGLNHTPYQVTLVCTDSDGDPLTYTADNAQNGTLSAVDGNKVTFTPSGDYGESTGTFSYHASDGSLTGNGTVTIYFPKNGAPSCNQQIVPTQHDTPVTIVFGCSDVEGDQFTTTIGSAPQHGTLGLDGKYTPDAHFAGYDKFTLHLDDGHPNGTRDIEYAVRVENAKPVCNQVGKSSANHTPATVGLDCTDADGDPLTYTITNVDPSTGSASLSGSTVTFTPNGDYTGTAGFKYRASDGVAGGTTTDTPGYVTFAENKRPQCQGSIKGDIKPDATTPFELGCSDAEGDPLTVSVLTPPAHGSIDLAARTYTPATHYQGTDHFSLHVTDGHNGSSDAVYSVYVFNNQPKCEEKVGTVKNHTPVTVEFNCTDPDGDPVSFQVTGTDGGSLSGTAPKFTFKPTGDAVGGTISYTASDGYAPGNPPGSPPQTNAHTLKLNIPANQGPSCTQESLRVTGTYGTRYTITPVCTDPEGDTVTTSVASQPLCGTATLEGGTVVYTPKNCPGIQQNGSDFIGLDLSDGHAGGTSKAQVVLGLRPKPNVDPDPKATAKGYLEGVALPAIVKALAGAAAHKLPGRTLSVPVGPFLGAGKISVTGTANGSPALSGTLELRSGAKGQLVLSLTTKARKALTKKGKLKVATTTTIDATDYGVSATTPGTVTLKAKKKK